MSGTIKVYDDRISVIGQAGITPNIQGETGLVFPKEIIQQSVDDYLRLIEVAPYYRMMLDSHVELKDAKWSNVGGMIDDVYVDNNKTVRINYTVFAGTPAYNAIKIMHGAGGTVMSPVSTRGFGRIKEVKADGGGGYAGASEDTKRVRMTRKLGDTKVAYWRKLGGSMYKNVLKMLDSFILLGWDLVVVPSQMEAGLPLLSNKPKIVAESAGGAHVKLMSNDWINMSNFVLGELSRDVTGDVREAAASLNMGKSQISPHVRLKLLDINNDFSKNIQLERTGGETRIIW